MKFFLILFILLLYASEGMAYPAPEIKRPVGDIRVLVLLVEFSDVKFKSPDPVSQFTDYLNKEGYDEYHNIGSVRDYCIYNSMGKFRPVFDVYGPFTLPESREYYATIASGDEIAVAQALDSLADDEINFLEYDSNTDGIIDYTYMIYAGEANSNDRTVFWPHAGILREEKNIMLSDGDENNLYVRRFAYSNEIDLGAYKKNESTDVISGIGIFVHEFSHLLGLPDYYYQDNITPGTWSVMDEGSHNCPANEDSVSSCAPPLYSSFDRMLMGWLVPTKIDSNGIKRLGKLDDNVAYQISNPNNTDEMYLLEYRTNKGWDIGQKNSGMLVWYIDYVDSVWRTPVNAREDNMHAKVIKAEEKTDWLYFMNKSSPYDVFPGKGNVTEFNGFVFKDGLDMNITLSEITESEDKEYVTFKVTKGEPFMREVSSSSQYSCGFVEPCLSSSSDSTRHGPPPSYSFVYLESSTSTAISQKLLTQTHIAMQNGMIRASTSVKGIKTIRLFSLNGQLLFETSMDDSELQFPWPRHLGKQKAFLSITRGKDVLYMGTIDGR